MLVSRFFLCYTLEKVRKYFGKGSGKVKEVLSGDSSFMNKVNKVTDLLVLNLMFMISCIPIVTIGASVTALYSVTLKMTKNEEGYITRDYRRAFITHFKSATLLGGILLAGGIFLALDFYYYVFASGREAVYVMRYLFYILLICYLFLASYVFVILGRFGETIRKSLLVSMKYSIHFLPYTLGIVFFNLAAVLLVFLFPRTLAYILTLQIFAGFSVTAYLNSHIFNKVFSKIEDENQVVQNA